MRERSESIIRTVFQLELEAGYVCKPLNRGRIECEHLHARYHGELRLKPVQDGVERVLRAAPLGPRFQVDEEQRTVGARREKVLTARLEYVGDLGIRTYQVANFRRLGCGIRQRRRVRRLSLGEEKALVLIGQEAGWRGAVDEERGCDSDDVERDDDRSAAHKHGEQTSVQMAGGIDHAVDRIEKAAVLVFFTREEEA